MNPYSGKIQDWQTERAFDAALMSKVSMDVAKAIRHRPDLSTGMREFVASMQASVLTKGHIDWSECPDDSFGVVWQKKQECLCELYSVITNIYHCYVPNTFFSDMYREKFDQALDLISDPKSNPPTPLLLGSDDSKEQNGAMVLSSRSSWMDLLHLLEVYRVEGKQRILQAPTVLKAEQALQVVLADLIKEVS